MSKIVKILLMLTIISCADNSKKELSIVDNVKKDIQKIVTRFNRNINIKTLDSDIGVTVELELLKPYVYTHDEIQKVFIDYIVSQITVDNSINNLKFICFLDIEKDKNKTIISYNKERINTIKKLFKDNVLYNEMVIFCLSNIKLVDPFLFKIFQEVVNKKYPDDTLSDNFFDLILLFSKKEGNKTNEDNKITMGKPSFTVYNMYDLSRTSKDEKDIKAGNIINELWKINYGSYIEDGVKYDKKTNSIYIEKSKGF